MTKSTAPSGAKHPKTIDGDRYEPPEWRSPRRRYWLEANAFGQWWPMMKAKTTDDRWCSVSIRDSNPFKSFTAACNFVEEHIQHDRKVAIADLRNLVGIVDRDIGYKGQDERAIAQQYGPSLLSAARKVLEAYGENQN